MLLKFVNYEIAYEVAKTKLMKITNLQIFLAKPNQMFGHGANRLFILL